MNEVLVTYKNKDQILKDTDFTTVDVLKFKSISGKELGDFLFSAVSQCVYNNEQNKPYRTYGRELSCFKHEGIILAFRTTKTTVYSYLKVTNKEPSLRGLPSYNGFTKVCREFRIKDFISKYRTLLSTQQEKQKTEITKQFQNEIERTTLAGMVFCDMDIPENNINADGTLNNISILVKRGSASYYDKNIHIHFEDKDNDIFNISLPSLDGLVVNKDQLKQILDVLRPFMEVLETK